MKLDAWIKLLVGLGWVGWESNWWLDWLGHQSACHSKEQVPVGFQFIRPLGGICIGPSKLYFLKAQEQKILVAIPTPNFILLETPKSKCVLGSTRIKGQVYIELDKRSLLFLDKEQMSSISGFCNVHRWIYINHSKILKLSTPRLLWSHACKNKVRKL